MHVKPGCCLLLRQGCSYDSMLMTLQHPVLLPAAARACVVQGNPKSVQFDIPEPRSVMTNCQLAMEC